MRERKGLDMDEKAGREDLGGKTKIRIYEEKNPFPIKRKEKKRKEKNLKGKEKEKTEGFG